MVEFETKCLFIFWRTWKILGTWDILTKNGELLFLKKKLRSFFYRCRTKNPKDDDDRVVTLTLPSFDRSGKNQNRVRIWSKIISAPEFVPPLFNRKFLIFF
jgi:hypothetical protein